MPKRTYKGSVFKKDDAVAMRSETGTGWDSGIVVKVLQGGAMVRVKMDRDGELRTRHASCWRHHAA